MLWVGGSAIALTSLSGVWKEVELTHTTLRMSCEKSRPLLNHNNNSYVKTCRFHEARSQRGTVPSACRFIVFAQIKNWCWLFILFAHRKWQVETVSSAGLMSDVLYLISVMWQTDFRVTLLLGNVASNNLIFSCFFLPFGHQFTCSVLT